MRSGSGEDGGPSVSPQRKQAVEKARQAWVKSLIDLSRRNNLLYYRPLKTGTLDLSIADPEKMAALLAGETVPFSKLLPESWSQTVLETLRDISRRALVNEEEKGLQTLFVALGMATWPAVDGGRPAEAPVLLLPVKLEGKTGSQSFVLSRTGAVQVNLVLLHVLETQYGINVDPDQLIQLLRGDDEGEPFDPDPVYRELLKRASDVPGLDVKASAFLGNFAFQKMAMVKDLQERAGELVQHDIIAAIAGDSDARAAVSASQQDLDPRELDRIPPDNEYTVLDADSSQQCAILAVVSGQNGVIHGPPGTGKSQTIVNLIAALAATGKRVLFVAEKRAALQVVQRRLKEVGLDHLAIDLHGADVSPKQVMVQVGRALDTVRASAPPPCEQVHEKLVERRGRLNRHVDRLHSQRAPAGKSVYELQGALLRLAPEAESSVRWRAAELKRITAANAQRIRDLLIEAAGFASLFLRTDPSPWTGASLPNGQAVQSALQVARHAAAHSWPEFRAALQTVLDSTGMQPPADLSATASLFDLVAATRQTLSCYSPDICTRDLPVLLRDLAPGKGGGLGAIWAWCTKSSYRGARRAARALRLDQRGSGPELYADITAASEQLAKWRPLSPSVAVPVAAASLDGCRRAFHAVRQDVESLATALPHRKLGHMALQELGSLTTALAGDLETPHQIPKLMDIEAGIDAAGGAKLVAELRSSRRPPGSWPFMFTYAWYASALDAACEEDPEIRGFKGNTHSRFAEEFSNLDEERIALAATRVRRAHAERAVAAMNEHPDQQYLIRAEAQKIRRHIPLRKLFAQAAEVLTAVCPCWMASPLSVSQLLDGGKKHFDCVIFDEASQVLPEDAVPAILRAAKVVVAGDRNQLPPTTFFAAGDDGDGDDADWSSVEGFESLLDMMNSFLRGWYLDWHYRSRDESLIAFSNNHIYENRLVTFPGPGGPPVIAHELVQQELGKDGEEESSSAEVGRVADLVLQHARSRPDETLGVIAMGIRHANRVQAALDRALETHPDLQQFFDPSLNERFFVKNLERVQGDERDAIILTVGYGKDRAGNLPFHFGPLLFESGRRRLNVAVTRARQRLTLVSSFGHLDMDVSRVKPRTGVELLRDYLLYAASKGKRLGDAQLTGVPPNDFEAEVYDALSAQGIRLISQMGVSRFRIDLVAEHPKKPGRFVLAIECDGASYHSSYTARDRDRLRQQQLEHLGWRFHRIWSTDWFLRKDEEIKRACAAYEQAILFADRLDSGGVPQNGNHGNDNKTTNSSPATPKNRKPRPSIPLKTSITQYSTSEVVAVIDWIASDGQLRTDDELIADLIPVLGFSRRGARIESAIRSAILTWRQSKDRR